MEIYENYLNFSGRISLEHVNNVVKIIKGKTNLLQKCLFLRILILTDSKVFEELETNGLRDIIHEWFTSAFSGKDVYFLILMVDSLYHLPELSDMSDLVKNLCNLNNPELTMKARSLLMKWKERADIIEKKNKFTYISLDKSSTVKRIVTHFRGSGHDDSDQDDVIPIENDTALEKNTKNIEPERKSKGIKRKQPEPINVTETSNSKKNVSLAEEIKLDEDLDENVILEKKMKKTKKVSWAPNEQLKTVILIEDDDDETTESSPLPVSSPSTLTTMLPSETESIVEDVRSPTYDSRNPIIGLPQEQTTVTPSATSPRIGSVLNQTLFDIIFEAKSEPDLGRLTTSEVYNILKLEQKKLAQNGITLIAPH